MANPTTNYSWAMPTNSDLVKDLPADFEIFGQAVDTTVKGIADTANGAIPKSVVDAAGDILYGTAADTVGRLGIGTSGQILSVSGSNLPAWTTPAASGGMTLISTTTLSGASVTLSSIPQTYKTLVMYVRNYQPATNGQLLRFRYNSDSGANRYGTNDLGVSVAGTYNGTSMYGQIEQNSTTATGFSNIIMYDYTNTSTWKYANVLCVSNNSTTSTTPMLGSYWAIYNQTSAISSITLFANSGNLTAGTVLLYGVS